MTSSSQNGARLYADRAGGTSRRSGNPPAVHFSTHFTPKSEPPTPLSVSELAKLAVAEGFSDGGTAAAEYFLNRISYQHVSEYFDLFGEGVHRSLHERLERLRDATGWHLSSIEMESRPKLT